MKRNKIFTYLLVLVGFILLGGCTGTVDRESQTVDEALIGHWVNTEGTLDYYFSDTALIKVENDGTTTNMTYTVVTTNDTDNTMTIEVTNPAETIMEKSKRDIKFSADKKAMTETVNIVGAEISEVQFNYVDGKTEP